MFKIACLTVLVMGNGLQAMDVNRDFRFQFLVAIQSGNEPQVIALLDKGIDVNLPFFGQSALGWAAQRGHLEICKLLLDKGADINAKNSQGRTALMEATEPSYYGTVAKDFAKLCKLLISKGANVNAEDNEGWTALMLAAAHDNKEISELLIRAMIAPTKEQIDSVVALLGLKKRGKTKELNWVGRDVVKLIGKEKLEVFRQENKPKAVPQIMKIRNEALRNELLRYLDNL